MDRSIQMGGYTIPVNAGICCSAPLPSTRRRPTRGGCWGAVSSRRRRPTERNDRGTDAVWKRSTVHHQFLNFSGTFLNIFVHRKCFYYHHKAPEPRLNLRFQGIPCHFRLLSAEYHQLRAGNRSPAPCGRSHIIANVIK